MIELHSIELETKNKVEFINITDKINDIISKSKIKNGFAVVFTMHTTSAIKISERETEKDKALVKDSIDFLERIAPSNPDYDYRHDKSNVDDRPNTHSHLKSLLLNSSELIPIKDGKLLLGQWQGIFFIELDGPREKRNITIQLTGE